MEVFDWLAGVPLPDGQKPFDVVEVRFKNGRKGYFRKSNHDLFQGDVIVVEAQSGVDVGVVSLTGELVKIQMNKREVKDNYELKKVLRKAEQKDFETWKNARKEEQSVMIRAREIVRELDLNMKIHDVEFQGDRSRATFYYSAEGRVDFRQLIKDMADHFKVRIEMRQIGLRVEAGRLGGIGSCGRELCCSSWLTDFRAVSTSAARYQQLSLNPGKLAGQCGKLKCCLNYELDQYVEAVKKLPPSHVKLKLAKGTATHFKTDIFNAVMYYNIEGVFGEGPLVLTAETVRDIIEQNKKGVIVGEVATVQPEAPAIASVDFAEVVGQDDLRRFDKKKKSNKSGSASKGGKRPFRNNKGNNNKPGTAKPNNKK